MTSAFDLRLVVTSAAYNLVRLWSGFIMVAILPLVARLVSDDEYNVWVLVTQVPSYVALFAGGLTVAVTRVVASNATDANLQAVAVNTATQYARRLAAMAAIGVGALAALLPWLYGDVPESLLPSARLGTIALGGGAAWALIGATFSAYFNGIHDNAASATWVALLRTVGAGAVLLASSAGLTAMFLVTAGTLGCTTEIQRWLYRSRAPAVPTTSSAETRAAAIQADLSSHMRTFAIWSVVGLLSSGLDIAIVGAFDFRGVGAYGAAAAVVIVVRGVHSAVTSAFFPDASRSLSSVEGQRVMSVLTQVSAAIAWWSVALGLAIGGPVLQAVFGEAVGSEAYIILVPLMTGTAIGMSIWPFAIGVLAVGEHRRVRLTPVVEGTINISASCILVQAIGAQGAAWGTMIAASVGLAMHLLVNVARVPSLGFDRRRWVIDTMQGASGAVPVALVPVAARLDSPARPLCFAAIVVSAAASCLFSLRSLRSASRGQR